MPLQKSKTTQKQSRSPLVEGVPTLPPGCGVYIMKDQKNQILYIGKAINLKSRVRSYFSDNKSLKNRFLTPRIRQVDYILTDTEAEAFLLEASLVKKHRPRYNIRLKDDKSYPYIRLSLEDDFPRFYMERRVKKKGSLYFGPYTEVHFVKGMIYFLNEQFQIRDCSNHFMKTTKKPCLSYEMGRCKAPCVQKINKAEYQKQVLKARDFLKGGGSRIVQKMKARMQELGRSERFEEAGRLKNRIRAIELTRKKQVVVTDQQKDRDILAFYGTREAGVGFEILCVRAGSVVGHQFHFESRIRTTDPDFEESVLSFMIQYYTDHFVPDHILVPKGRPKLLSPAFHQALLQIQSRKVVVSPVLSALDHKLMSMALTNAQRRFEDHVRKKQSLEKGLEDIQKKFRLPHPPERIECFDVSHFQGKQTVASQVVFEKGEAKKTDYRRYRLQTVEGVDDFASLREVLTRRLKHTEMDDPDLIVVDGGKGQLKQALWALKETGREDLTVVAMAKARSASDFKAPEVVSTEERFFIPGLKNAFVFASNSQALKILVRLRDEAHRFAISYHRRLSEKSLIPPSSSGGKNRAGRAKKEDKKKPPSKKKA